MMMAQHSKRPGGGGDVAVPVTSTTSPTMTCEREAAKVTAGAAGGGVVCGVDWVAGCGPSLPAQPPRVRSSNEPMMTQSPSIYMRPLEQCCIFLIAFSVETLSEGGNAMIEKTLRKCNAAKNCTYLGHVLYVDHGKESAQ